MPTILIIEPSGSGHRPVCLRRVVQGAMERSHHVVIAGVPELLNNPLIVGLKDSHHDTALRFLEIDGPGARPRRSIFGIAAQELAYRRYYQRTFNRLKAEINPDLVFVPSLDLCVNASGLIGAPFDRIPWSGLVMQQTFHCADMGLGEPPAGHSLRVKKHAFLRLLKNAKNTASILTFDEALKRFIDENHPDLANAIRHVPDPADLRGKTTREAARKRFDLPANAFAVLLYGSLRPEKGVETLIDAMDDARIAESANVHLLFVGRQHPSIKHLMQSETANKLRQQHRLHELNQFVSDEDEYAAFQAADLIWLGYHSSFTSSGVLVQAAQMGRPVLACQEGLIGWHTKRYELGRAINAEDPTSVAATIKLMMDNPVGDEFAKNGRKFYERHTVEQFKQSVYASFEELLAGSAH